MRVLALIFAALAVFGYARPAQAAEELPSGAHPHLRNDEATLQGGYGVGFGDSLNGLRLQGDYFHWLEQSAWLDMQMAAVSRGCNSNPSVRTSSCGTALEIAVGAVWRFQTNLPIVPYVKVAAGPLFMFPQNKHGVAGIVVRGGFGVHYHFWRRLGVVVEVTGAGGIAFIGLDGRDATSVGDLSATAGVVLQY